MYKIINLLCSNHNLLKVQLVVNVCWKKDIYVTWKVRSENSHLDEITAIDTTIARLTIFTIRYIFSKYGYFFNQPFLSINNCNVFTTIRTLNSYFNNNLLCLSIIITQYVYTYNRHCRRFIKWSRRIRKRNGRWNLKRVFGSKFRCVNCSGRCVFRWMDNICRVVFRWLVHCGRRDLWCLIISDHLCKNK